jgi:hypothetical protein
VECVIDGTVICALDDGTVVCAHVDGTVACALDAVTVVFALDDSAVICAINDGLFLFFSVKVDIIDMLGTIELSAVAGDMI